MQQSQKDRALEKLLKLKTDTEFLIDGIDGLKNQAEELSKLILECFSVFSEINPEQLKKSRKLFKIIDQKLKEIEES